MEILAVMLVAGPGIGLVKILRGAENREWWVYLAACLLFLYACVTMFYLWRCWRSHCKTDTTWLSFLGRQLGMLVSSGFAAIIAIELVRRMVVGAD